MSNHRLEIAKKHIFSTGLGDIGSSLCRENMKYGIAKIHYVQEQLGMEVSATFVSGPDETVTKNKMRWKNGFGYGGKISWGDGTTKVIILDVMPNACGMLVGGMNEPPKPGKLIERINAIETTESYIDGVRVAWDFSKSNHFIDVFKVVRLADIDFPDYAFIIHSGSPELKGDNAKGFGLYVHESDILSEMADTIETPFGKSKVILDNDAREYLQFFHFADNFSKKKRMLAAEMLFDNFERISNPLHQGLLNYNEIILGAHYIKDKEDLLFPLVLRADLPAYLIKGKKNLSDEMIEILGFSKRAKKLGVYASLKNANILPHGGGYTFRDLLAVTNVMEVGGERYFEVEMHNAVGHKIFGNPKDIEFIYRGREVVIKTLELGLGELEARLIPEYVLKV
ncbi:MAG: hypothetical protein GKB99_04500 [Methanocellales archaeon]|nr:hypothetical protein [Methanocellales archaeon]